jgi:hypothetical protein
MADFCMQCSERLFGEDFGDLAKITTPEMWADERSCVVICEGCGHIQVDPEGRCVSSDCLELGHVSKACLDPNKMHGAGDGSSGSDFP